MCLQSFGDFPSLQKANNCLIMEIVVGTYEEIILGYYVTKTDEGYAFQSSFSDHSHTGSVKALAISEAGILVSASTDETMKLYKLGSSRCELGTLMKHSGTINGLQFHGKDHMFSYSEDGTICIWKTGKWECLRTLHCHKSPVKSVSIHPSGKMALSVSKDKALRIWNLMTARCAYTTKMKEEPDLVVWSPDGNSYLVIKNKTMDIYDVKTAAIIHTVTFASRINAAEFIDAERIVIGGEGGIVEVHDLTTKEMSLRFSTETSRVKGFARCQCPTDDSTWLFTASSDGFVKLWQLKTKKVELLAAVNTKFRLTTIALKLQFTESIKGEVKEEPAEVSERQSTGEDDSSLSEEEERLVKKVAVKKQNKKKLKGNLESGQNDKSNKKPEDTKMKRKSESGQNDKSNKKPKGSVQHKPLHAKKRRPTVKARRP